MTSKEIAHAEMLDILFENRNKSYGAYALRRGYDNRLLAALGAGLGLAGLLVLTVPKAPAEKAAVPVLHKEEIRIREYVIPPPKPETPRPAVKLHASAVAQKTKQVATRKFVSRFEVMKDSEVKTPVAAVEDLRDMKTGETDWQGIPDEAEVQTPEQPDNGVVSADNSGEYDPFTARESAPEFPGGANALYQFLARKLRSPGELLSGEKIVVKIRFRVESDGTPSAFEIMESGGKEYDNEVLRVCRTMPRWKPALQNGMHVPVNYMIPVTFIGTE